MGLINRRKRPINARLFGTWRWDGNVNTWTISFNNQLSRTIQMSVQHLAMGIGEIDYSETFPDTATATTGKRIKIRGMYGFGDDYRWYADIHGVDGRHYFFQEIDSLISANQRIRFEMRDADEVNSVPFEADGDVPDLPTHRHSALVSESDPQGRSESPTMSLMDEDFAEFLAPFVDMSEISYDEICSYLFGAAKPWRVKVLEELKLRHEKGTLNAIQLDMAISRYKHRIQENNAEKLQSLVSEIEASFRRAQGYGFDPPGGWGALGPD
jgi:hypothetical protein